MFEIHNMDCIAAMRTMPDNSVDSIVTDPPYELGFMGKAWDSTGIANSVEMWREALRVLKPGGHLLAFSGSRTYHHMTCAIEDAGFEVRDQIMWLYGSGFPKSLDVGKAIDKAVGVEGSYGGAKSAAHAGRKSLNVPEGWDRPWMQDADAMTKANSKYVAGSDAARQWEGWGTALKPAHEPICVARKPLIGTVAANVLAHGTGALNIDGCRVSTNGEQPKESGGRESWRAMEGRTDLQGHGENVTPAAGRWPANLIHDGSDEVLSLFPETISGGGNKANKKPLARDSQVMATVDTGQVWAPDIGSAARFFYCAKTSKADRGTNTHPTVKPTDLMAYLVRLVTPPGGLVLDPFMGSGSTGKACMREGFRFVGCELSAEYVDIATARIEHALWGDLV